MEEKYYATNCTAKQGKCSFSYALLPSVEDEYPQVELWSL